MYAPNEREEKRMYTYEDFENKVKEYGFTPDQISEADYKLAQQNPDAGIALLGYKNDWLTATNDSAKAFAHAGAEDIRKTYGNYSGGENGGSFRLTGTEQYEDPWETTIQSTIKNMQDRKFEWNPETDPNVQYYTDMYNREGERAMKDVLGAVAATTGGIPSSYATAAAAQQRNYYAQQLTDKYPELYQQAFDRFMQEYENDYMLLDAYMGMSDTGYNRWSDTQDRNRNARLDAADAAQRAFENDILERETESNIKYREDQTSIAWAELGMKDEQFNREMDYKYDALDQEDQQFIKELLYKYDVFNAENAYKLAALAQDKEIADKELQYKYDALSEEAKQFVKELLYKYDVLDQEASQHADEVQLARDQMAADEEARAEQEYNDIIRAIISSGSDMSVLAAMEAMGIDTTAYREQIAAGAAGTDEEYLVNDGLPTEDDVVDAVVNANNLTEVNGGDETGMTSSVPTHIRLILEKQERGQKLTESEKIILEQYNKTGKYVR